MLNKMKITIGSLLFFISAINIAGAQINLDMGSAFNTIGESMPEIIMDPPHPQPQEIVKLTINDYKGDYTNNIVEWFENGKKIPNTDNLREIKINSGDSGETKVIKIVYTDPNKLIKKESIVEISPVYIDIILEPQTHVPDFYAGRALPTAGSITNVTAVVDSDISKDNLIYIWKINNNSFGGINGGRGVNKTYFTTPNRNSILTLTVKTDYGKILGRRVIFVKLAEPEILFYETNSLLGTLGNRTLEDTVFIKNNTITITSEPYFLDSRVYNQPSYINWSIDGRKVSVGDNPYKITLKETGLDSDGENIKRNKLSNISFIVQGDNEFIMQGARKEINIKI